MSVRKSCLFIRYVRDYNLFKRKEMKSFGTSGTLALQSNEKEWKLKRKTTYFSLIYILRVHCSHFIIYRSSTTYLKSLKLGFNKIWPLHTTVLIHSSSHNISWRSVVSVNINFPISYRFTLFIDASKNMNPSTSIRLINFLFFSPSANISLFCHGADSTLYIYFSVMMTAYTLQCQNNERRKK